MNRRQRSGQFALCLFVIATLCGRAPQAQQVNASYKLEALVPPAVTHGVHGMKFDQAGKLVVGDVIGYTLWRVDIDSGEATALVESPFGCADDLAFAPDGTLVWTSLLTGVVYGLHPSGDRYEIAHDLLGVNSIGFTRDGRLFATQLGSADKLWELDPAGRNPPRLVLEHIQGLNGFRIDDHDTLWGPQGATGNIISLDLRTLEIRTIARGFVWPTGVDRDASGNLYVVDLTAGSLTRVDPRTGAKTLVRQLDPGIDNLTISPSGKIYVSNPADNSIVEVDPDTRDFRYVRRGILGVPGGVAVRSDHGQDTVYVADTFSYKAVDGKTGAVHDLGRKVGSSTITSALSVRATATGLLISHFDQGVVKVINLPEATVVRTIKGLDLPHDALMLDNGDILVAELLKGLILRITNKDERSVAISGLNRPVGMVGDGAGGIYVTEAGSGKLTHIDLSSGRKDEIATDLLQPEGVDRGPDGAILVIEAGASDLLRIDPSTRSRQVLASHLPISITAPPPRPPTWIPNGVAVGSAGVIYVSGDLTGTLLRLTPNAP